MLKRFNACVAIVALLAFSSCGDDNNASNNGQTNNGTTPNNGTTTPNNGTTTNNGTTAPNNGTTTPNNNTTTGDLQCDSQGDACEPGEPTADGFVCVRPDANSDAACQTACIDPRSPDLAADAPYPCASGQLCVDSGDGAFACVRSDCTGVLDTTSCAATESCFTFTDSVTDPNDPDTVLREGTASFCDTPADTAVGLGEDCTTVNGCAAGLACIGTCVQPCGDDAACTANGESCIGEEADFLGQGAGFCDVKCEPYKAVSGCEGSDICNPLTSTEGICNDNEGDLGAYDRCTSPDFDDQGMQITFPPAAESCGANLRCIGIQGDPNPLSMCLPFCDPTLATPAAQSATCEGVDAHCFDLAADGARPNSGVCFASCTAADYGNNTCVGTGNSCTPINGDRHACFPGVGTAALGESCNADDRELGCQEGLSCATDSTGAGTCTSYCEPNPVGVNLGCQADEACSAIGSPAFNFGICGKTCTPTDYADTSCPANLQNCTTAKVGDVEGLCSASGNVALGAACPAITNNTCVPGDTCVNDWMRSLEGDFESAGQCTTQCDLFAADTGCAANEMCAPSLVTLSETTGYCLERGADAPVGMACEANKACGPTSTCLGSAPGQCIPWCLLSDGTGCAAGQQCMPLFGSPAVPFGFCQ